MLALGLQSWAKEEKYLGVLFISDGEIKQKVGRWWHLQQYRTFVVKTVLNSKIKLLIDWSLTSGHEFWVAPGGKGCWQKWPKGGFSRDWLGLAEEARSNVARTWLRGSDGMGMNLGLDRRIVLYVLDSQRVPWGMVLGNGDPIDPTKSAATTAQKSEKKCMYGYESAEFWFNSFKLQTSQASLARYLTM